MGGGDVKLAGPLGAVLAAAGWPALVLAALAAALLTGGIALVAALLRGLDERRAAVPHGPSMLGAGWLVTLMAAAAPP